MSVILTLKFLQILIMLQFGLILISYNPRPAIRRLLHGHSFQHKASVNNKYIITWFGWSLVKVGNCSSLL